MPGPLAGKGGIPILGKEDSNTQFVGRAVLELFEGPATRNDGDGLAMVIGPALTSSLSQQDLLIRIAKVLPNHIALGDRKLIERVMGDPLAERDGIPMVGRSNSDKSYVGRVVIELFEHPKTQDDADSLITSISPALASNLSQQELLKRIAVALPDRIALRDRTRVEQIRKELIKQQEQLHS